MGSKVEGADFEEFQTPVEFAKEICGVVKDRYGFMPDVVIEPTCGVGNFVAAALETFGRTQIIGVEIDEEYCREAKERFSYDRNVKIWRDDFFRFDLEQLRMTGDDRSTLFIGSTPWVSEGESDVSEDMVLHMAAFLKGCTGMIAVLCRKETALGVIGRLKGEGTVPVSADLYGFDASRICEDAAEGCLLALRFGDGKAADHADLRDLSVPDTVKETVAFR